MADLNVYLTKTEAFSSEVHCHSFSFDLCRYSVYFYKNMGFNLNFFVIIIVCTTTRQCSYIKIVNKSSLEFKTKVEHTFSL